MGKDQKDSAETTEMSKSEAKAIIKQAYPEGKVVKMNERIKVKCIQDTDSGMIKGKEYEMHPTTAAQLRAQKIVE